MPELPDLTAYVEAIERRTRGRPLTEIELASPFLLRSVDPPICEAQGKRLVGVRRLGKRIVLALEDELFLVFHLMIAGRFRWHERAPRLNRKTGLAALHFPNGHLAVTEAGSKKRASLHIVRGETALRAFDPGGLEVLDTDLPTFCAALTRENHTLKRALTDPRILSGIGNAYSDEILFAARLSPMKLTSRLDGEEIGRLYQATRQTLGHWVNRLRTETGDGFPDKVTAFREGMAVHGRHREPCPACQAPVQRIAYARNEANYCARCQTGGRLLADRALSRLLKQDWPKTLDELEQRLGGRDGPDGAA